MTTALIDGDSFIYMSALANEQPTQWSTWLWTLHANLEASIAHLNETIADLKEKAGADEVIVALTDDCNFRKSIYPEYKEHRKKTRKPVVYVPMRQYVHEAFTTYQRPGLEGDDVLGILATAKKLIPGPKVIVSIDKDLKTIPGTHLNLSTGERYEITEEQADRFHLFQTITGDQVDGYPGAPGFGPVKAEELLAAGLVLEPKQHTISRGPRKGETETRWEPGKPGTPWEVVVSAYRAAGLNEEVALTQARVARILRVTDYDFEKKEVIPWTPPQ